MQFFSIEIETVKDYYFALVELETATSEEMFAAICNLFKDKEINSNNFIGFASNNVYITEVQSFRNITSFICNAMDFGFIAFVCIKSI